MNLFYNKMRSEQLIQFENHAYIHDKNRLSQDFFF